PIKGDKVSLKLSRQNWLLIVPHFMKHPSCYKIEKDMLSLFFLKLNRITLRLNGSRVTVYSKKKPPLRGGFFQFIEFAAL
ncbi:hypothetical protein, partial [Klebsiella pneumoniae]|uniref:hypothetical protein n=1 Tax=Klebsiella pneumoniae TaxID=573 RepID=UPI0025A20EDE